MFWKQVNIDLGNDPNFVLIYFRLFFVWPLGMVCSYMLTVDIDQMTGGLIKCTPDTRPPFSHCSVDPFHQCIKHSHYFYPQRLSLTRQFLRAKIVRVLPQMLWSDQLRLSQVGLQEEKDPRCTEFSQTINRN